MRESDREGKGTPASGKTPNTHERRERGIWAQTQKTRNLRERETNHCEERETIGELNRRISI